MTLINSRRVALWRSVSTAIYQGEGLDLIPSSPLLAKVEREMVGITNSELRLAQRVGKLRAQYDPILLDTPPTFGPLINTALNAASQVLIPVLIGHSASRRLLLVVFVERVDVQIRIISARKATTKER